MTQERINLPPHPRILVIALRRLGDVLLSTPLIRSIKQAWPEGRVDALVFAGDAGGSVLTGSPWACSRSSSSLHSRTIWV